MDESLVIDEVLQLSLAYKQGEATEEEVARLERLLTDNPEAVVVYLRVIDDTLTLREAAEAWENGSTDRQETVDHPMAAAKRVEQMLRSSHAGAGRWNAPLGLVIAVSLLLCAAMLSGVWMWWSPAREQADGHSYQVDRSARVVSLSNVQWTEGAPQYGEWSFIEPGGRLDFRTGIVDLYLANGVELLMEGPADVRFESLDKMFVSHGKVAARVGPEAVGFQVETPHARVIDRGTLFGVSVNQPDRTAVVVYEGKVDVAVLADPTQPPRRLETGEALSVGRDGQLSRITTVQSSEFLEPPQARAVDAIETHLINSVSDNVRSLKTAKYYRVITRGFQEDCRAYVDRQHEWNGLDGEGLPPFLVGGDYLMTFNDDKIATQIEIAVGLSQPATLYVLIDDRVPPPEWLKRDFVDTNWDVGLDEGYTDRDMKTDIGQGQSVDQVCSVWKREVREPTTVILGALSRERFTKPPRDVERSMYGIVAIPLKNAN